MHSPSGSFGPLEDAYEMSFNRLVFAGTIDCNDKETILASRRMILTVCQVPNATHLAWSLS